MAAAARRSARRRCVRSKAFTTSAYSFTTTPMPPRRTSTCRSGCPTTTPLAPVVPSRPSRRSSRCATGWSATACPRSTPPPASSSPPAIRSTSSTASSPTSISPRAPSFCSSRPLLVVTGAAFTTTPSATDSVSSATATAPSCSAPRPSPMTMPASACRWSTSRAVSVGSATRGECHDGSKRLHPVVHLHVFNTQGQLYLQRRPQWKDIQPGAGTRP